MVDKIQENTDQKDVYVATFIYIIKEYDAVFEELNSEIDKLAEKNAGYIGKESWENKSNGQNVAVYYWNSLEQLRIFSKESTHLKAKSMYSKWYKGYKVIISKVVRTYGDGKLSHILD